LHKPNKIYSIYYIWEFLLLRDRDKFSSHHGQNYLLVSSIFLFNSPFVFYRATAVAMMWFVSLVIINIILPCCLGEESATADGSHWMDFWVVRLLLNLLGYATIFVPGFLLMRYLRSIRYNETAGMILNSIYNLSIYRTSYNY
jgi:hypothetical protein